MNEDRAKGALLGLAVGDALGTTYEFERLDQPPHPHLATKPATDVVGGGPFQLAPGAITDDTQLAVCLARSLAERGELDVQDLGARYLAWVEEAFDVGNQTHASLYHLRETGDAALAGVIAWRRTDHHAAGNGSLMRTAAIGVAFATRSPETLVDAAIADSMITHADPKCMLACAAYDAAIAAAIARNATGREMLDAARAGLELGARRLTALWRARAGEGAFAPPPVVDVDDDWPPRRSYEDDAAPFDVEELATIDAAKDDLARDLDAALAPDPDVYGADVHLQQTAGFVRLAFRLAFWHCVHTPSWRAALVDVASRGGDADTNGAITGALLGARDGASAIPEAWMQRVLAARQRGSDAWAEAHHPRHLLLLVRA